MLESTKAKYSSSPLRVAPYKYIKKLKSHFCPLINTAFSVNQYLIYTQLKVVLISFQKRGFKGRVGGEGGTNCDVSTQPHTPLPPPPFHCKNDAVPLNSLF